MRFGALVLTLASASSLALILSGCGDDSAINNNNNNTDGGNDLSSSSNDLSGVSTDMPASGMSCDLIAQDCGTGNKCVLVTAMGMGSPMCVATTGAVADGQACMRGTMGAADNCAAGLTCGGARGGGMGMTAMSFCRKFCKGNTDCDTGQSCTVLSQAITDVGVCAPTCTPFTNDCGTNQTCTTTAAALGSTMQMPKSVFTCRAVGMQPKFADCNRTSDCAANTYCSQQGMVCMPLCDDANPCGSLPVDGGTGTPLTCTISATTISTHPGLCN